MKLDLSVSASRQVLLLDSHACPYVLVAHGLRLLESNGLHADRLRARVLVAHVGWCAASDVCGGFISLSFSDGDWDA